MSTDLEVAEQDNWSNAQLQDMILCESLRQTLYSPGTSDIVRSWASQLNLTIQRSPDGIEAIVREGILALRERIAKIESKVALN